MPSWRKKVENEKGAVLGGDIVKEGLSEEGILEQRPEGGKGISHASF
jgi:hypothetical protein